VKASGDLFEPPHFTHASIHTETHTRASCTHRNMHSTHMHPQSHAQHTQSHTLTCTYTSTRTGNNLRMWRCGWKKTCKLVMQRLVSSPKCVASVHGLVVMIGRCQRLEPSSTRAEFDSRWTHFWTVLLLFIGVLFLLCLSHIQHVTICVAWQLCCVSEASCVSSRQNLNETNSVVVCRYCC
jgi:hypothetical protein